MFIFLRNHYYCTQRFCEKKIVRNTFMKVNKLPSVVVTFNNNHTNSKCYCFDGTNETIGEIWERCTEKLGKAPNTDDVLPKIPKENVTFSFHLVKLKDRFSYDEWGENVFIT